MATLRLKRFSTPKVLQAIDCTRLLTFLQPYCTFFLERGVSLPPPASSNPVPFDRLIDVFMSPDESTPTELVDALYHVDGMATEEGMPGAFGRGCAKGGCRPFPSGTRWSQAEQRSRPWTICNPVWTCSSGTT
jgi:hypothetical protein